MKMPHTFVLPVPSPRAEAAAHALLTGIALSVLVVLHADAFQRTQFRVMVELAARNRTVYPLVRLRHLTVSHANTSFRNM
jgi:hypothetical protein